MTRVRKPTGRISFLGAGAGDVDLLSARAGAALAESQLVLCDPGVPETLRDAAGTASGAEVRVVDAAGADTSKVALTEARGGATVVRLVAGDVMANDAVVKEIAAVAKTVVPYEVIPGVDTARGAAAYAGIATGAVTTSVTLLPGATIDWDTVAAVAGTVQVTTDAAELERVTRELVSAGKKPDTPAAVTADATGSGEHTVVGTLGELELLGAGVTGTVVVTVGKAVASAEKLGWWESRPLFGWRVLVPRTKEQAGTMSARLRQYGAVPVEVPTIAVEPPRTPTQMERAIKGLVTGRFEWIVFTSTNAVKAVREKFAEFGLDARAFAGVKIACVGTATADAVRAFGIEPELLPSGEQSSEGLLADFPDYDEVLDPINRVLLPRADIATETLAAGLRERGWEIDDVTAYRTVRAAPPAAPIRDAIKSGGFQAVCFTSSSTVRNLVGIAGKPHARTVVAAIGPQTAATATEFGLRVDVQPDEANVEALVDALAEFAVARAAEQGAAAATAAEAPKRSRSRR
ncbi:uroporphyrinogen-III synthase [Jatrophihabitans sp. YIM 134969]